MEISGLYDDCLRAIFSYLRVEDLVGIEDVSGKWRKLLIESWKKGGIIIFSDLLRLPDGTKVKDRTDKWTPVFFKILLRSAPYAKGFNFGEIVDGRYASSHELIRKALVKLSQLYTDGNLEWPKKRAVVTELYFPTRTHLSFVDATTVIGSLSQLQKLTIIDCQGELAKAHIRGAKAFGELLKHLPDLSYLKTDMRLCAPALSELSLECEELILHHVIDLSVHKGLFSGKRPSLHTLVLAGCEFDSAAADGTPAGDLSGLVTCAPNLHNLDLSRSDGQSLPPISNYQALTQLMNLKEIYLNDCCNWMIDFKKLTEPDDNFAHNITTLQLMRNWEDEEEEMVKSLEVVNRFINLRSLALCGLVAVDHILIFNITWRCRDLEELYLRHCVQLNGNKAAMYVGRQSAMIRILDVSYCTIDGEGVETFISERVSVAAAGGDSRGGGLWDLTTMVTIRAEHTNVYTQQPPLNPPPSWFNLITSHTGTEQIYSEIELQLSDRTSTSNSSSDPPEYILDRDVYEVISIKCNMITLL